MVDFWIAKALLRTLYIWLYFAILGRLVLAHLPYRYGHERLGLVLSIPRTFQGTRTRAFEFKTGG